MLCRGWTRITLIDQIQGRFRVDMAHCGEVGWLCFDITNKCLGHDKFDGLVRCDVKGNVFTFRDSNLEDSVDLFEIIDKLD